MILAVVQIPRRNMKQLKLTIKKKLTWSTAYFSHDSIFTKTMKINFITGKSHSSSS